MPIASSEFITLCQSQVTLLTQVLGASLSIVYLTGELVEGGTSQTKLIPIVAYPETAMLLQNSKVALLPEDTSTRHTLSHLPGAQSETAVATSEPLPSTTDPGLSEERVHESYEDLLPSTQIVLPLIHEEVVMGLLVTGREDRPWNEEEKTEIERIAQTLALACLLDRRREWLEQQLSQQQRLRAKQRDLLDNLLHQFRNPLTALRTFGKLLLKRFKNGDANSEVAASIVRESDRLQELLQQFDRVIDLTAEDLELRKSLPPAPLLVEPVQPAPKPILLLPDDSGSAKLCQVAAILEPLLTSARAIAQERGLDIRTDIPPNLPSVIANAKALREVLSNLIDNALKYTPSGGQISIQGGLERDNFQGIAISDTGLGIPPEDLTHIFERHYRGVQAGSAISGTGLGLAIAKELVEQMQGEIQVFSPARPRSTAVAGGPGVTFIVWLKSSEFGVRSSEL